MSTPKTLRDWRAVIRKEIPFVDIKPYSHNIISISLQAIAKDFGVSKADQAIEDFRLEGLGWQKEKLNIALSKLKNSKQGITSII